MRWSDIKRMMWRAAKIYYHWLGEDVRRQTAGFIFYDIISVSLKPERECVFVEVRVADMDIPQNISLFIDGNRILNARLINVEEEKKPRKIKLLRFEVTEESYHYISGVKLTSQNVRLGYDLRFLIERVANFYEKLTTPLNIDNIGRYARFDSKEIEISDSASETQRSIIKEVLTGESLMTYVWGAPGTGKTKVVLANVAVNYLAKKRPVLVVAPTNIAIDTSLSAIIELAKARGLNYKAVSRYGVSGREFSQKYPFAIGINETEEEQQRQQIREEIGKKRTRLSDIEDCLTRLRSQLQDVENEQKNALMAIIGGSRRTQRLNDRKELLLQQIDEVTKEIDKHKTEIQRLTNEHSQVRGAVFEESLVVGCTIDHYILNYEKFSPYHILVDEAAYCSLIRGVTLLFHEVPITMFGDHMQLQPICEMTPSMILRNNDVKLKSELIKDEVIPEDGDLKDACVWDMSMLYMWNLFNQPRSRIINAYKYTERPEVMCHYFLKETYRYSKRMSEVLDAFVYQQGLTGVGNNETKIKYALVEGETIGNTNVKEAEVIKQIVEKFASDQQIGILCPYKKQQELISQTINRRHPVLTVHKSQGQEYDIVILCVTDARQSHCLLTNSKLFSGLTCINTAVSRAKKELIIVCNPCWMDYDVQLINGLLKVGERIL